ncbi:hypothetical protein [Borrelia sp. RT1S]|uniref:hypothetical protein n=1 Tax=Borrelia sp. RT1S TaxID=2898580 RepID=UPI001E415E58|nr:hypothetical protein [Borrelia sp. RT1S]UGQ17909.1 hypothetical protein LSO05_05610 [Borrelia sp. RT1S]
MQEILNFLHNLDLYKFIGLVVAILAIFWLIRPVFTDCIKIIKKILHIKDKQDP